MLICQACSTAEGNRDNIIYEYPGDPTLYAPCPWCNGTGEVTPEVRGQWLRYKRDIARAKREKET